MALHMKLCVNGGAIGDLIATRLPHRQPPQADDICHYDWSVRINGEWTNSLQPLAHRFGDGAWTLVARVLDAAGYDFDRLQNTYDVAKVSNTTTPYRWEEDTVL